MTARMLYHPRGEQARLVESFCQEFKSYKRKEVELVSLESPEGADLAKLYDITDYPALLVISNDGSLLRLWQGNQLPLMDELSYYLQDAEPILSHTAKTIMPLAV